MSYDFGACSECGSNLEAEWFTEEEYETIAPGVQVRTGRVRRNIDYLICPYCFKKSVCDDSFAGPWSKRRTANG